MTTDANVLRHRMQAVAADAAFRRGELKAVESTHARVLAVLELRMDRMRQQVRASGERMDAWYIQAMGALERGDPDAISQTLAMPLCEPYADTPHTIEHFYTKEQFDLEDFFPATSL